MILRKKVFSIFLIIFWQVLCLFLYTFKFDCGFPLRNLLPLIILILLFLNKIFLFISLRTQTRSLVNFKHYIRLLSLAFFSLQGWIFKFIRILSRKFKAIESILIWIFTLNILIRIFFFNILFEIVFKFFTLILIIIFLNNTN